MLRGKKILLCLMLVVLVLPFLGCEEDIANGNVGQETVLVDVKPNSLQQSNLMLVDEEEIILEFSKDLQDIEIVSDELKDFDYEVIGDKVIISNYDLVSQEGGQAYQLEYLIETDNETLNDKIYFLALDEELEDEIDDVNADWWSKSVYLTVGYPDQMEQGEEARFHGWADGADKIVASVDGYVIGEKDVTWGTYEFFYSFYESGNNRDLVINAFDRNGNSLKQLERDIDVQPEDGGSNWGNPDWGGDDSNTGGDVISGVPYFYQYHNGIRPWASCQNTSLAMLLAYYGWSGHPDDISYEWGTRHAQYPEGLAEIFNHYARGLGLNVRLEAHRFASVNQLNRLLAEGKPVITHGHFTGEGHVVLVTGFDGTNYHVNDPAGKWNQYFKGGYPGRTSTNGRYVEYYKDYFYDAVIDNGIWLHEVYYVN